MANEALYSLIYVRINGALLTEEASVRLRRMTNAQVIKTVAKGFAGMSPGAPMAEIALSNAIPAADFEFDAGPAMLALETVEVCLECAGKQAVCKGFITEDGLEHAVDSPSKYDFNIVAKFPVFQ